MDIVLKLCQLPTHIAQVYRQGEKTLEGSGSTCNWSCWTSALEHEAAAMAVDNCGQKLNTRQILVLYRTILPQILSLDSNWGMLLWVSPRSGSLTPRSKVLRRPCEVEVPCASQDLHVV